MKVDYVHKDTLTATDYVELNKNNELLISYNQALLKENQKLKKQLETYEIEGYKQDEELNKMSFDIRKYKIQQKEFIKYLEDGIEKATTNPYTKLSEYGMNRIHIYKEILQKYKSIIGGKDEKDNN